MDLRRINCGGDDFGFAASLRQYFAGVRNDEGFARIVHVWLAANSVARHHNGLIFYGARDAQRAPVIGSWRGPTGG